MHTKIFDALQKAGHGLTPNTLHEAIYTHTCNTALYKKQLTHLMLMCSELEQKRIVILHRSSGSAGVPKGEITLVCLRQEGH